MRVTLLGTGAAGGVPLYGCDCTACERARQDSRYRRRPCSALVEADDTRILLDAGLTDLDERFPPGSLSAIVLTHYHPDHVQGLFHLRWGVGDEITVYAPPDKLGCGDLYKNRGLLQFSPLRRFEPLTIGTLRITPLPLIHSKPTFGYLFEDSAGARFAYITDTRGLPPTTEAFLSAQDDVTLVLDCSFPPNDRRGNHNDWNTALYTIAALQPQHTWLTHIDHRLDAWALTCSSAIQERVSFGQDGTSFDVGGQ